MSQASWFKPKKIGYGATPTTPEGWAVTAGDAVIVWASGAAIASHRNSTFILLASFASIVVATLALRVIGVKTTEGRWGRTAGAKQVSGKNI
jgi:hypothetical protein